MIKFMNACSSHQFETRHRISSPILVSLSLYSFMSIICMFQDSVAIYTFLAQALMLQRHNSLTAMLNIKLKHANDKLGAPISYPYILTRQVERAKITVGTGSLMLFEYCHYYMVWKFIHFIYLKSIFKHFDYTANATYATSAEQTRMNKYTC